ncbi:hypothetical protein FRAHR75_130111 [Frankia sp. Hr75.2]|nr:hypothetical protein FRAHR75_130111 [Frankia sp. Hr75.2]
MHLRGSQHAPADIYFAQLSISWAGGNEGGAGWLGVADRSCIRAAAWWPGDDALAFEHVFDSLGVAGWAGAARRRGRGRR